MRLRTWGVYVGVCFVWKGLHQQCLFYYLVAKWKQNGTNKMEKKKTNFAFSRSGYEGNVCMIGVCAYLWFKWNIADWYNNKIVLNEWNAWIISKNRIVWNIGVELFDDIKVTPLINVRKKCINISQCWSPVPCQMSPLSDGDICSNWRNSHSNNMRYSHFTEKKTHKIRMCNINETYWSSDLDITSSIKSPY